MTDRYCVRPDHEGHTVFDVWTGEAVVIAMDPQTGLSLEDAEHTARMLNQRVARGERLVRQNL